MIDTEIIYSLNELDMAVELIKKAMTRYKIFAFEGTLGAGKTTLIRALLRSCGVTDVITSPTFTYVNVYHDAQGHTIYHFDLYRIETVHDFLVAGFDEYLSAPHSISFIEWPEVISPLLRDACLVKIDYYQDKRKLTLKPFSNDD